ncbi:MAG: hypothetical protein ABIF71_02505 [Planctomycetota bacterium]
MTTQEQAHAQLDAIQDQLDNLTNAGADPGQAGKLLERARQFFVKGDYEKVVQIHAQIQPLLDSVAAAAAGAGAASGGRVDSDASAETAVDIMTQANERITQIEGLGINVGSLKDKYSKAYESYNAKRYAEVIHICEEILVLAKVAREEIESSLGKHIHGEMGDLQKGQKVDPKYIQRLVEKILKDEIEKLIHSRSLRQMVEMVAEEEAVERTRDMLPKADLPEEAAPLITAAIAADREQNPPLSAADVDGRITPAIDAAIKGAALAKVVQDGAARKVDEFAKAHPPVHADEVKKAVAEGVKAHLGSAELGEKIKTMAADIAAKAAAGVKVPGDKEIQVVVVKALEGYSTGAEVETAITAKLKAFTAEVDKIARDAAAKAASGVKVPGEKEIQAVVQKALEPYGTEADTKAAVDARLKAFTGDVEKIAREAAAKIKVPTEAEIAEVVTAKLKAFTADVEKIAAKAAAGVKVPGEKDIQAIVQQATADFSTEADINEAIAAKLKAFTGDVDKMAREAAAKAAAGVKIPGEKEILTVAQKALEGYEKITRVDVEKIATKAAATAAAAVEVPSGKDIQAIVTAALQGVEKITAADVERIAREVAVEAAGQVKVLSVTDVDTAIAVKLKGYEKISRVDVEKIALKAAQDTTRTLVIPSTEEIRSIVAEATSGMEALSGDQVAAIVAEKLGGLPQITEADVRRITEEVVAGVEYVGPAEVESMIKAAKPAGPDLAAVREELKKAVAGLLASDIFKEAARRAVNVDATVNAILANNPPQAAAPDPAALQGMVTDLVAAQVQEVFQTEDFKALIQVMVAENTPPAGISADEVKSMVDQAVEAVKAFGALEAVRPPEESSIGPFGFGDDDKQPAGLPGVKKFRADGVAVGGLPAASGGGPGMPAEITKIVRLEIEKTIKTMVPASGGGGVMTPEQLKAALRTILPDLLTTDEAQSIIISTVAMQAIMDRGSLGELTGLRAFLTGEINRVVQDMQKK